MVNCTGSIPSIRSFHAACSVDNFMFIHGGESQIDGTIENNTVPTASRHSEDLQQAVLSSSGADIKQSVKTPSIVESSVWNSTVDEEPESVAMDGVCPGDTIGFQRNLPTVYHESYSLLMYYSLYQIVQGNDVTSNPIDKIPRMCCVDDFYVLDTISREWHKISCILSPLPRKGHSMVIANIDNKPHVVIFGGYSSDNLTLSNSIHVCEVSKVLQHYKNCQTSANSSAINKIKALRQQETSNKPVVFRTLNCKGTPPTPRYRHSCTIVSGGINEGGSQEQFMVVVGGIGKDPNAALCDVHVLNLNTLQWLNVPSDALEKGHAGEGPSTGIYGHTAFAVPNVAATSGLPVVAAGAIDNAIPVELMVYGGSSNATSGKSNCHRHIYGLDLMTYQWRRIRTGFAFPSARNNHSAAVISGWAPSNTMPSSGGLSSSMGGSASAVVVFGGVNSIMCASDTWALDLKWRPPGVDAYDGNINERLDEGVAYQVTQKPVTPIEQHFLKASGVGPLSGTTTTENLINAKTNRSSIQASNDEKYFSLMKPSSSTGALLSSSAKGGTAKLPPSGKNRTQAGNRNQYQDESEGEEAEEEQVVQVLKVSASDPNFQQSLRRLKQSNNNSSAMNASRSYDFLGTASEQLNRELLQSTMMLATSETAGTEDQQVGHAFLKVR